MSSRNGSFAFITGGMSQGMPNVVPILDLEKFQHDEKILSPGLTGTLLKFSCWKKNYKFKLDLDKFSRR